MAVDMFIKIGDLKGETKDKDKKDFIDVLAWSWGLSQSGTTHTGGGGGSGKVSVQDISLTKYVDIASAKLMLACCTGKHFDTAQLIVRKAGEKPLEYIVIDMTEVIISSVSTGGSGGEDRLTENVSLNFAKVKFTYAKQGDKGAKDGGDDMTYDIAGNASG